ncbi:ead/Ea22-like family protein [Salmonella enterica]|nr:ead/Ea22-like family protein [Salmonella enterica subsp. enterica]EBS2626724.1 ead/Ea22-like family protein [Salmonella enterica subsp. enterica serovar Anatum]HAK7562265.1 ead/Ea22-like family protein [Salmonella enterica]EBV1421923.1 ead/Ea22-like family protein [Salmonella enterica subsp. enterica serovar Anatum]EBV7152978.1 ead/Ea22-like family protein [Salmonella enterica subsp. enterica serovar Anatum]
MNIDKRALREVAEKATKGPWSLFSDIDTKTFSIHTPRDKRCENVIKWGGFDCQPNAEANAEFIAAFNPKVALALLDENIQLQREKDAIEAVALALRDDMRDVREQLEAAEKRIAEQREYYEGVIADGSKRIAELERSETQLINERDSAESALNDAYKAVMGQVPEWSNWFSFENAIDEIELVCELWRNQTDDVIQFRQRIQELEAKLETTDRLQDGAFRDGLKAGFSYGQTDDQSGFTQCMSAYSPRADIKVKGE